MIAPPQTAVTMGHGGMGPSDPPTLVMDSYRTGTESAAVLSGAADIEDPMPPAPFVSNEFVENLPPFDSSWDGDFDGINWDSYNYPENVDEEDLKPSE